MQLRYHVPILGYVMVDLHQESEHLYEHLHNAGEVARLNRLDHLGIMRFVWEGAHHSRWEYTVLILSLIERCKAVPQIHLGGKVRLRSIDVSSGYELLKSWALLLNTGHLVWTFAAERALLLETWSDRAKARQAYVSAFRRTDRREFARSVILAGDAYRFFQTLVYIRAPRLIADANAREVFLGLLDAYVLTTRPNEQLGRLKRIFGNLRRLAYMALDTRYTPAAVTVDLTQSLTDGDTLARFALRDPSRETDELDGLGEYLNRETYLGARVMVEMARRERSLRLLIRRSIGQSTYEETVEALADGSLQEGIECPDIKPVVRVSSDIAGGLAEYWPGTTNARIEQERLNKGLLVRSRAVALYWRTAGADWVLQGHTLADDPDAIVNAFLVVWNRAIDAQAHARELLETERSADAYSERLASSLLLQVLPLFFDSRLRWEWGVASSWGEAVLAPRRGARWILKRLAEHDDVSASRGAELAMVARTLRGRPHNYVAVALAPLVAYRQAEQVAELDGCLVMADADAIELTVVEAKRQRTGARAAAQRALTRCIGRLRSNPHVNVHSVNSELLGGLARAWVTMDIRPRRGEDA